jgi:tRNA nucleotidyltransferase (CCA-adding enzyme)
VSGLPVVPASLRLVCETVRARGGRALLVGGAVRDGLLGRPFKDYDLEVFGLDLADLEVTLRSLGRVDGVGRAFGILKLSGLDAVDGAIDVALPRRDSKVGPGHRGIAIEGDPHMSLADAARRRDFTINALLFDPLTLELLDPHGGQRDLTARRLRAVDLSTFGEDPLRALRAVQLAARFELAVEPETARLCATLPLAELPAARVFGEIEKLLLASPRPSRGLALMHAWRLLPTLAPELVALAETPQDPVWHPEGDVWTHTLLVVDEAAALRADLNRPRALALMLAALCHDLGKPATTQVEEGRLRSRGHEEAGVAPTTALLDRWDIHSLLGYDVRAQTIALVAHHLKPGQLYDNRDRVSDGAIRRLAGKCDPDLLYRVARADCVGRRGGFEPVAMEWFLERVRALDAHRLPVALLQGRDLLALGLSPGPEVGRILRAVYERQLDGEVTDAAGALSAAREILIADDSSSDRKPSAGATGPPGIDSPHRE